MRLQDLTTIVFIWFLVALAVLLAAFAGVWPALVAAAAAGLISIFVDRLPPMLARVWMIPVLLATSCLTAAVIVAVRQTEMPALLWASVPLSSGTALCLTAYTRWASRRCALCSHRIGSAPNFVCPRCALVVCEQRCWSHQHLRCQLCIENEVRLLSSDCRWWDTHLGPRADHGQCRLCFSPAAGVDLRHCRNCGRPQCVLCWDMANGQCTRCSWTIDDVALRLDQIVPAAHKTTRDSHRA